MPDMLQIKGQFSVPWSSPDAFGLPYPEAFLFGEDGTIGSKSFGCVGTDVRGYTVPSSAYSGERSKSIDVRQITWVVQDQRRSLLLSLPGGEAAVRLVRELEDQQECDLFDVLAGLGYGLPPKWRNERAAAFTYKNKHWLKDFQERTSAVPVNMAKQFERNGIEELETPKLFEVEGVDFNALIGLSVEPSALIQETKVRLLA